MILVLTESRYGKRCMICSRDSESCVEMNITRKTPEKNNITAFAVCGDCLAEMKRDIETSFTDLAFWYRIRQRNDSTRTI